MQLNTLKPAKGAKPAPKRLGRGIGSGLGKTSGKGHKGQRARAGGYHKVGFEGGQMPVQRRLPKFGFTTSKSRVTAEVRLSDLAKVEQSPINLNALRVANLIGANIRHVKVFMKGELKKAVKLVGIKATAGAKAAIEAAGGSVEVQA